MGKSLKYAVGPDEVCGEYGCDTLRLYEMYMGPLEASKPWNPRDIIGLFRFLQRMWRLFVDEKTGELSKRVGAGAPAETNSEINRALHRTIAGVTRDIEKLRFNTAIAKLIELVNVLAAGESSIPRDVAERFVLLVCPFAPHLAEELWSRLGHGESLAMAPWPDYDEALLVEDQIELPVQFRGKVRARLTLPADATREQIEQAALANDKVMALLAGKTLRKVVVVPGKIVNIVAD